ncbi:MAG TPA: caspase family protein, partial [Spirochaetia bacterium]|nr:caspase family protein [Spirochaetia bacterium]
MRTRHSLFFACLIGLLAAAPPLFADAGARTLGRFALIIGSNDGGHTRVKLKYAASDATAFSHVLTEMGGLDQARQLVLLDPTYDEVIAGFARINSLIRNAADNHTRNEFIVYYSGHSDEQGLLIRGRRLPYLDLRELIDAVPADVRIAIIDSCASGVFIRSKGGTKQPAFLVDSSNDMRGYAFLTSSSDTEAAQESDRIGASFFTHHLIGGLRGAADVTRDGLVTLNEVYHYAFNETLAVTEKTRFGPQHPSYDIQLTGTGDLVLT